MDLRFEQATEEDFNLLVELRIESMRESLEAIGRFNRKRSIERFRDSFDPVATKKLLVAGHVIGFYSIENRCDHLYLNHLYIDPKYQSQGVGSLALRKVFAVAENLRLPIRLGALRESRSNDFYRKHGFEVVSEDEWDIYYERKANMEELELDDSIVSVEWLAKNLNHPDLIILDGSMWEVAEVQIPGALVFDFDKKICDQKSSLPHMMPTPEEFQQAVRELGINESSVIVVYDLKGIYSSVRSYWMFRSMGHEKVSVLDGGLPAWIEAGLDTEPMGTVVERPTGDFVAKFDSVMFCDADTVEEALESDCHKVLDARSEGRFYGKEPEPREGMKSGHMPGAVSLPFADLLENGHFKSKDELAEIIASKASKDENLIFSCGSGVTACIVALAAQRVGYDKLSVYDGSWSEWGLPASNRTVVLD